MVVLLPTIACLMDKSEVAISESYVETCSIYAILVGFPSAKKITLKNLKNLDKENFTLVKLFATI